MAFNEYIIGKRERISFASETSYGAGATMSGGFIPGLNCTMNSDADQGYQETQTTGTDDLLIQDRVAGPLIVPISISFAPHNWRFMKYLMSNVDAGSNPYTHTFSVSPTIQSFAIEKAMRKTGTSSVITFTGCFLNKMSLSFTKPTGPGKEGLIKCTVEGFGRVPTEGSSVTSLSAITDKPFMFHHVKFTEDGNEIVEVNNGDLMIERGINAQDSRYANQTGDRYQSEPIPTIFRVSGKFNINLKDKTHYTNWAAGVPISGTTKLELIRGVSPADKIVFTFTDFIPLRGIPATNIEGVTSLEIPFIAKTVIPVATDAVSTY